MNSFLQRFMYPFRVQVSYPDRILEVIAFVLFIVAWMLTIAVYQQAPEQIPTHFNMNGVATQWSTKSTIWGVSAVFTFAYLIAFASVYNHKLVNMPIRLKAEVLERQLHLMSRMSRFMSILVNVLWISALVSISGSFMSISSFAVQLMLKVSFVLLFIPAIYYSLKIWWIGRNYR